MGSYTFTWAHAASEVFVTGDFDNWQKTIQLEKGADGVFKKTVDLPKGKHAYKFVVDGTWLTNESHPGENDASGNYNNVLEAEDITEPVGTLSSAAPESTTAALAGLVPKEETAKEDKSKSEESVPGAFPLTPPVATPGSEPQTFAVNPIPATSGLGNPVQLAPGDKVPEPSTLTDNTVQSTVKLDKEPEEEPEETVGVAPIPATAGAGNPIQLAPGEKVPEPSTLTSNTIDSTVKHDKEPEEGPEETVGVAPIPATAGAGNPIQLAPGEKVPDASTLTSNTVSSTAKTDAESYEKSDSLPPQLDPVALTPEVERAANGGLFHLPPLAGGVIPESSLPKDLPAADADKDTGVTIQSAAPTSTTAALAGQVPLEPRDVPAAVTESQEKAGFAPEASANPEAVAEKKEVEEELKEKVPEEPATTETPSAIQNGGATAAAGVTAAAGAFAAATYAAKDQAAKAIGVSNEEPAPAVPEVVAESQKEAHVAPEASANPEAVEEKKAVEAELLKANGSAEANGAVSAVPEVVAESQKEAHASPEAAANAEAVEEKKEVEAELLKEVKTTDEAGEPAPAVTAATTETAPAPVSSDKPAEAAPVSEPAPASSSKAAEEGSGLNAPASAPAQTETAPAPAPTAAAVDSRDVSPMSKQATTSQTQPAVTTGVESGKADTTTTAPETPSSAKDAPESVASGTTDKKKKRTSIFGKIKAKLTSKH